MFQNVNKLQHTKRKKRPGMEAQSLVMGEAIKDVIDAS